jgi:long-chain acyl-CoA synthetase
MLNPESATKAKDGGGRSVLEASLAEHLKKVNAQLDPHEQLDCVVITAEAWSVENDILTPTMKVKRNKIEDIFAANYERWVGMKKKVIWSNG